MITITISTEQVEYIKNELAADYENVTDQQIADWFQATVQQMIAEPAHYANGSTGHQNTSCAAFGAECIGGDFTPCADVENYVIDITEDRRINELEMWGEKGRPNWR